VGGPCCIASEAQLHADVRAAWRAIAPAYPGRARVFYGRSLGSGLAAELAAEVPPELTLLASPCFSMEALADEHYPWVPRALLRDPLRTAEALARVNTRVLMLHGSEDRLIEVSHARRLKTRRPQTKLVEVADAAHKNLSRFDTYRETVAAALEQAKAASAR
jgi:alpha-beta hydrolase superfamily lysophospholipase